MQARCSAAGRACQEQEQAGMGEWGSHALAVQACRTQPNSKPPLKGAPLLTLAPASRRTRAGFALPAWQAWISGGQLLMSPASRGAPWAAEGTQLAVRLKRGSPQGEATSSQQRTEQRLHGCRVALLGCPVQGGQQLKVGGCHVSARSQQQAHDGRSALAGASSRHPASRQPEGKGREASSTHAVLASWHLRGSCHSAPKAASLLPPPSCTHEGCLSQFVSMVDSRPPLQQQLHSPRMAPFGSLHTGAVSQPEATGDQQGSAQQQPSACRDSAAQPAHAAPCRVPSAQPCSQHPPWPPLPVRAPAWGRWQAAGIVVVRPAALLQHPDPCTQRLSAPPPLQLGPPPPPRPHHELHVAMLRSNQQGREELVLAGIHVCPRLQRKGDGGLQTGCSCWKRAGWES